MHIIFITVNACNKTFDNQNEDADVTKQFGKSNAEKRAQKYK